MRLLLARATAVLTAALGLLVAAELAGSAPVEPYALVLVAALVTSALGAAAWLWTRCSLDARVATGGLAGTILAGQLLLTWQGGPGGPALPWQPTGVAVAALAVLVLLLAATAAPDAPAHREHPYAL